MSEPGKDVGPSAPPLSGVHHAAYRCRDAEETRAFYQDLLGLPLRAALVFEEEPGTGRKRPYMHLFFELGDGRFIAFFDVPDSAKPEHFAMKHGMDVHIALEAASMAEVLQFKERLTARGVPCFGPIDHHFVHSLYFYDPNGLNVEITCRDPSHDAVMLEEGAKAQDMIAAWSARTAERKRERGVAPA
jgi:catechol 2,3-dioxygenase-like lactoylglutathione lyase family enzyme